MKTKLQLTEAALNTIRSRQAEAEKRYNKEQSEGDNVSIASTRATFLALREAGDVLAKALSDLASFEEKQEYTVTLPRELAINNLMLLRNLQNRAKLSEEYQATYNEVIERSVQQLKTALEGQH